MTEKVSENVNPIAEATPVYANPHAALQSTFADVNVTGESEARAFFRRHHWPTGLQDTFFQNLRKVPLRFFICDDSSSMSTRDGHKLVESGGVHRYLRHPVFFSIFLYRLMYIFMILEWLRVRDGRSWLLRFNFMPKRLTCHKLPRNSCFLTAGMHYFYV